MTRQLVPIFALILGSAFLMVAGGLNGLILPLRGTFEGFSTFSLGLLGTGWAIGYIGGCITTPRLVRRAGHIRTFAVMAAVAVLSVLTSLIFISPSSWILLRALAGFSFAGAAMIVESWLNENTEFTYRGRVFGVYTMVNLLATTAGQLMVALGDATGYLFFVLAAIFYALSLIPSALTRTEQPRPLVETGLDIRALMRNSPLAVIGVFLVGVSNSTFGTLGVVYGTTIGLDVTSISLMMSLTILAGSGAQVPVGYLSDRIDRRKVLIGLTVIAAAVDLFFLTFQPESSLVVLAATFVFGGAIYSMYPVIIAHANDHADSTQFLKISGGLLLVFGIGSIVGPLAAGVAMTFGPAGMFATTFGAHLLLAFYGGWRMTRREAVADADKTAFVGLAPTRLATPESVALDPRAEAPGEPVEGGSETIED